MSEEITQVVYCPRCDRSYPNVEEASNHVDLAHPDQLNPFKEQ